MCTWSVPMAGAMIHWMYSLTRYERHSTFKESKCKSSYTQSKTPFKCVPSWWQSQQLQSPGRRTVSAASAGPREITGTPTRDNVDMIKLTPVSVREDYNCVMTPEEGVADMFWVTSYGWSTIFYWFICFDILIFLYVYRTRISMTLPEPSQPQ